MDLASATDSTSLSYWLSWEFFVCLLSVFTTVIVGSFLIWKYEGSDNTERVWSLFDGEAWMPCVKGLSPVCLLAFRIIASCLLLAASIADVATHGTNLFYYYTQWSLILTIIYFVFGSLLSTFGCFQQEKTHNAHFKDLDEEKGVYAPLTGTEKAVNQQGEYYFSETRALWGYIFQIVFQVTAGAVMLTDGVYWLVIFPFLTIVDYEMGFLTIVVHSLNLVLLLGDTAMNNLRFPWFRISYFILFTAVYVIFEWIVHAFVDTWYWVVAVLHLPCYAMFGLFVKTKYFILTRGIKVRDFPASIGEIYGNSHNQCSYSRYTRALSKSEDSEGGHWKSISKKKKSNREEDDLPQRGHIKTYDGSEDPEDHLKILQAAAKTERWAMPTWCHMFNSTLIGNARVWFDDLPAESIDSYDDLKKAFLENYLQQKKCIKDPIEIHNIKQWDEESTEDFVKRYKLESRDGEVAASNHERKKSFPPWKQQEGNHKQNFKKGGFQNHPRPEKKQDRFTLLTKTPKDFFALDKGKFKAPPPMTTPVEKRNHAKFCEFHGEVGHNTDECIHLKKQIEEMLKVVKLLHLIKELKQNNRKE
nr:protein rolling stone-like isoform X2 [Tanacetum cinerariifolium]